MQYLLGGLILALPIMAQSSCSERTYTTNIGLTFDVKCDINIPKSDIFNTVLPNLNACMDACAERGSDEKTDPCQAVAWNTVENRCWMKGRGLSADQGVTEANTIMAFSDPTVWTDVTPGCGYDNNTVVTDSNGQQFQVICDTRYKGDNYDPDIRASYPAKHAATLEDCLQYCSNGSPFCWGVLFSPTMESGYSNCYAKTANATTQKSTWVSQANMITAVAWNTVNTTCAGDHYTASNGAKFNTSCDQSGDSPDIEKVHADNFEACQELCAVYKPDSGNAACQGVLYQPSSRNGYLNCHLKYGLTNITALGEWNLAILDSAAATTPTNDSSSTPSPSPGSSSGSSDSNNAGLIAGAVVGPVAGISIIAALFFWWRRRRQQQRQQQHYQNNGFHQQPSPDTSESELFHKSHGYPMMQGQGRKHEYMQAPSTPHTPYTEPAEMATDSTRQANEMPVAQKDMLRHELQG